MPVLLAHHPAQVVQGIGVARLEYKGPTKARLGKAGVVQAHVDQATQGIGLGKVGIGRQRLLEFIEGDGGLALLEVTNRQFEANPRTRAFLRLIGLGDDIGPCGVLGGGTGRGTRCEVKARQYQ